MSARVSGFSRTYRYLLPELAKAGYRAVAPFMRGYAPTEVTSGGHYQTSLLAADVVALQELLAETPTQCWLLTIGGQ